MTTAPDAITAPTPDMKGAVARLSRWVNPSMVAIDTATGLLQSESIRYGRRARVAMRPDDIERITTPFADPVVIPWSGFAAAIRSTPRRGSVTIGRHESGDVVLRTPVGQHRFTPTGDHPITLADLAGDDVHHMTIPGDRWSALADAYPFICPDDSRPILTNVMLGAGGFDYAATDSYTLAVRGWPDPDAPPAPFPIYRGHVHWMRHAIRRPELVKVWAGSVQAAAAGPYLVVGSESPVGPDIDYPDVSQFLRTTHGEEHRWEVVFPRTALTEILTVVDRLGGDSPFPMALHLEHKADHVRITRSDPHHGIESEYRVEGYVTCRSGDATDIRVAFSANYLRRCVCAHDGDFVSLQLVDELKPATIHDPETVDEPDAVTTLVMPVRIQ